MSYKAGNNFFSRGGHLLPSVTTPVLLHQFVPRHILLFFSAINFLCSWIITKLEINNLAVPSISPEV